jgi:hypothetical protein
VALGLRAADEVAWEAICVVPRIETPKLKATSGADVIEDALDQAVSDALNRLLAGFGVRPDARTEAMIDDWHRRALATWRELPEAELADLVIAEAEADLNHWFGLVLGEELIGDQPPARAGRAAYLLCGAGQRWPECFLRPDPLPEHVTEALRNAVPPATPPAQPGSMPQQALESWRLRDLLGTLPRAGLRALLGRTITATP